MPDDPKKKRRQGAAASPAVEDMSPEMYMDALRSSLGGAGTQPEGEQPEEPQETPVQSFWSRLIHGVDGKSRIAEIARSVPRGAAEAVNSMAHSAFEFGAWIDRKTGLGEALQPGFNAAYDEDNGRSLVPRDDFSVVDDTEMVAAYGARSDDPLAAFSESVTQFATSMLLLNRAGLKNLYVAGAATDALAFDPYEASLAELVAKIPVTETRSAAMQAVGDLLSVEGDDGPIVARLKRSVEGVLVGAALDAVVWGSRSARASKQLADPGVTPAAQEEALDLIRRADEALRGVADGTGTPDGAHLVVRPSGNGNWTLKVNPESPWFSDLDIPTYLRRDEEFRARVAQQETKARSAPGDDVNLDEPAYLRAEGKTVADVEAAAAAREEEAALIRRQMETVKAEDAAREGALPPPPESASRGEMEMQAASLNDAIDARLNGGPTLTAEQSTAVLDFAKKLVSSRTADDVTRLLDGTHFNFSYIDEPVDVLSKIEAISEVFRREMDGAQGRPGVPVEESFRMARKALGGMLEAEAPAIIRDRLKNVRDLHAWLLAGDMVMRDMGRKIGRMSEVLDARPHDVVAAEEARLAIDNFFRLTRELAGANSETGRALRILQERSNALAERPIRFKGKKKPSDAPQASKQKQEPDLAVEQSPEVGRLSDRRKKGDVKTSAEDTPPSITAGMNHRQIASIARMVRMAGGAPRDAFAVARAARVIKQTGKLDKAMEVFANFLLSGPKTAETVLVSGAGVTMFEPVVRMVAGVTTRNRALLREGADIMWGNFQYLKDNLKSMGASLRAGRSIINPQPQRVAIGGVTGDIVRLPGRLLMGLDELIRVTNYRSFVRAKSLRVGREQGLSGAALEARVADDLRNSFDAETGIALLPDALKYAETPTFSGPLGHDTFGGKFHDFTNNAIEAKFIAPFVKASVNIFRYVWQGTPLLNIANRQAREIMKQGGEAAAVLHSRSALAATVYGTSLYMATSGNLTGRGPTDPELRKLWLRDHQPYSVRVGDQWLSYRRSDPLSTPLGLIADLNTMISEGFVDDGEDVAYAIVAAITQNLGSKTYLQGITQFAEAFGSGDEHGVRRWLQNFSANMAVPQLVSSVSEDDYYREVRGLADAVIARIPGWSETLPPKHNIFGEPVMRVPGVINRGANPFTAKQATQSVAETALLELERGLSPAPAKLENGLIDLFSPEYDNGTGKLPYVRWMELIRTPQHGDPNFRQDLEALVRSSRWTEASDGTETFPGGKRWLMAAGVKEKHEQRALQQLFEEYPKLANARRMLRRMRGAAIRSGESGVAEVEALFGQ